MAVNVLNFVFHVLNVRLLSVLDYGMLASLFAASTIVSVPSATLNQIIVRYGAEFHALGDQEHLRALRARALLVTAGGAAAIMIGAIAFRAHIAVYLRIAPAESYLIPVTAVVACVNFVLPAVRGILQGVHDFGRYSISLIVEASGKMLLGVGLVYAGFALAGALGGYAVASIIGLLYTYFAVGGWPKGGFSVPLKIDIRRLARTSGGITAATICLGVMGAIDLVLVKHFFDPRTAGAYAAISLVGKPLMFVVGFIPAVLFPVAAAKVARNESPIGVLKQATLITGLLCTAGLLVLLLQPRLVTDIMAGGKYVSLAAGHVFSYGIVMALYGFLQVLANYKMGLNRYDFILPLSFAAIGEIAAISLYHPDITAVIHILLIGHTIAVLGSLYRIGSLQPRRAASSG